MAEGAHPEDAAGVGGAEAKRVLLGEQRLADAAEAAQLGDGRPCAGDEPYPARLEVGVKRPQLGEAPDEAARARALLGEPARRGQRLGLAERTGEAGEVP